MKGRKPKLHIVEDAPAQPVCAPPAGFLCSHGISEWKRVAPLLQARGHLTDDTLATLESYCRAVGLSRTYTALMNEDGHVISTEKGPVTHPAFKMLMGTMREARLLAAELGLTPQRRGKAANPKDGDSDEWPPDLLA